MPLPNRSIEEAVLRTILYADVFHFPLTIAELHHFLITPAPVSLQEVTRALDSPSLRPNLAFHDDYIMRAGRDELAALRWERERAARVLWDDAIAYGRWLGRLPFVRMVAITGALAMRNPSIDDDDLDYVLVTAPGRVWVARAFAIAVVRLARRRGVTVCPNYVVAESALVQDRRDLFIAHELAQMAPVCGRALYEAMRGQNPWVAGQLPNATHPFYDETEQSPRGAWRTIQQACERLLGGALGDRLEAWEYRRKAARFARKLQTPHSAAVIDPENVKGHFNDHGHPVLRRYHELLMEHDLDARTQLLAGD